MNRKIREKIAAVVSIFRTRKGDQEQSLTAGRQILGNVLSLREYSKTDIIVKLEILYRVRCN